MLNYTRKLHNPRSVRLQNYDYSKAGMYYVTICTLNRVYYFRRLENNKMVLNELGKIVETEWQKTVELRPDMNLELGEFVVMPNHFHGIICIGENQYNQKNVSFDENREMVDNDGNGDGGGGGIICWDAMHCVPTNNKPQIYCNKFGPQSNNLASIICGFKSSVTTYARTNTITFHWQSRFHEHIIRDEASYQCTNGTV